MLKNLLRSILWKYFIEHKNNITIEKETGVTNGYISKIVRGIVYPKEVNAYLLEIKKKLDNQQPNLQINREVQRL